ncbi:MAG: DUF4827 family protein [Muribaculaceae bacterium]|nr:DUF4827 family protein [Muribaculaceae bacterium]
MKRSNLFLILPFLLLIFAGCSDEPELDLFHLTLGTEADADVAWGLHSGEITINGYARWIDVGIVGDFDSYTLSDDVPAWLTVIPQGGNIGTPHHFRVEVSALGGSDSRTGKVGFTVFKGSRSQSGTITIVQNPCTLEDLKKTEQRAMKKYLSKFDVIDVLPAINDIQVGSVAPFYKLNSEGTVYMQVVRMGTQPAATIGETIYFRFMRYNLLAYLENGVLPNGEGNLNSATQDVTFFELGSDKPSTAQWGTAIQMPMQLGLPVDSEVNLIVASEAGLTSEISYVTPFLYNILYLKATM